MKTKCIPLVMAAIVFLSACGGPVSSTSQHIIDSGVTSSSRKPVSHSSSAVEENYVEGVISSADGVSLTIKTELGTVYTFSIADAAVQGEGGLLSGNTAVVHYKGVLDETRRDQTAKVLRIVVTHQGENVMEGIVSDATMNTLQLTTSDNMNYLFSTEGAKIEVGPYGLILGDTVQVYYTGAINADVTVQTVKVNKVVVIAEPKSSVSGTVVGWGQDEVQVLTRRGNKYTFNTKGARLEGADGIAVGEGVTVFFSGQLNRVKGIQPVQVNKIAVTSMPENTLDGIIASTTPYTMVVRTVPGAEYLFSLDGSKVEGATRLMVGDTVRVLFSGVLHSVKEPQPVRVITITVLKPAPPPPASSSSASSSSSKPASSSSASSSSSKPASSSSASSSSSKPASSSSASSSSSKPASSSSASPSSSKPASSSSASSSSSKPASSSSASSSSSKPASSSSASSSSSPPASSSSASSSSSKPASSSSASSSSSSPASSSSVPSSSSTPASSSSVASTSSSLVPSSSDTSVTSAAPSASTTSDTSSMPVSSVAPDPGSSSLSDSSVPVSSASSTPASSSSPASDPSSSQPVTPEDILSGTVTAYAGHTLTLVAADKTAYTMDITGANIISAGSSPLEVGDAVAVHYTGQLNGADFHAVAVAITGWAGSTIQGTVVSVDDPDKLVMVDAAGDSYTLNIVDARVDGKLAAGKIVKVFYVGTLDQKGSAKAVHIAEVLPASSQSTSASA